MIAGRLGTSRNISREQCSFRVLGVSVDAVQIPDAIAEMERWIRERRAGRYIAVTGMHGITVSRQDPHFKEILNQADLVVPDGMPLVWLARWHHYPLRHRVSGSELMAAFCRETGPRYRHFFYGGAPGVADKLSRILMEQYGIVVAGTYCPPFRPLREDEEKEVAFQIHAADPDILWVGLSTPKQEQWMYEHRGKLQIPVMLGVGAAFDFNSGRVRRAPAWMGELGLEWFFRLVVDPRRLWRRYLIAIPKAAWSIGLELLHLRNFS